MTSSDAARRPGASCSPSLASVYPTEHDAERDRLVVLTAPSAACWLPGVNPCCTLEAGGVGGLPRPYRLANVHVSLRLAHVAHGSVPEHRIFLTLHASQARLTLKSFLRFSDASPVSGDGACSEAYDRLGVDVGAAGESMNGEGESGVSVKLGIEI